MAFTTTADDTFTDQRASTFTLGAGGATAGGVGAVAVPTGSTYTFASRPQGMAGHKVYGSFAGNRNKDERELIAQGGRRPHHQN